MRRLCRGARGCGYGGAIPPCAAPAQSAHAAASATGPVLATHRSFRKDPCCRGNSPRPSSSLFASCSFASERCFSTSAPLWKATSLGSSGTGAGGIKSGTKTVSYKGEPMAKAAPSTPSLSPSAAVTATGTAAEEPQPQQAAPSLSTEAAAAAVTLTRSQLKKHGGRRSKKTATTTPPADAALGSAAGRSQRRKSTRRKSSAAAVGSGGGGGSGSKRGRGGGGTQVQALADDDSTNTRDVVHEADTPQLLTAEPVEDGRGVLRKIHDPCAVSPLYFTENTLARRKTTPTEAELIAERASITKLFVISDSVASIFSALPHDQNSINDYLSEVDRAVPPTPRHAAPFEDGGEHGSTSGSGAVDSGESLDKIRGYHEGDDNLYFNVDAEDPLTSYDIMQRVLVEQNADHSLCIHVRDMEQLVPPAHLLSDAKPPQAIATSTSTTVTTGSAPSKLTSGSRRGRRGAGARKSSQRQSAQPQEAAVVPTEPQPQQQELSPAEMALRTLQRIKTLHEWRAQAALRAQQSQERWALPENCHSITRVRMHDPHKTDLTVVQGCGGPKSVADVLAAMRRKLDGGGYYREEDDFDDEVDDDTGDMSLDTNELSSDLGRLNAMGVLAMRSGQAEEFSPTTAVGGARGKASRPPTAALVSAPFVVKPLLTVYASCIPRRESQLGAIYGEALFRAQGDDVADRDARGTQGGSEPTTTSYLSSSSSCPRLAPDADGSPPPAHQRRLTDEELHSIIQRCGVPPMPRYSTRITLLVEHNELEPSDLLSLAEMSTARKDNTPSSASTAAQQHGSDFRASSFSSPAVSPKARKGKNGGERKKMRTRHMYCLVVDGGEI